MRLRSPARTFCEGLDSLSRTDFCNSIELVESCPDILCNWSLHPFNQDCGVTSYTTYIVCVKFIHEWCDQQFTVEFECEIFFEKFFMAILFTLSVFARNLSFVESSLVWLSFSSIFSIFYSSFFLTFCFSPHFLFFSIY